MPGASRPIVAARAPIVDWRVSLALFCALALACYSLHVLLQGGAWWFQVVAICALVVGAAAITRRLSRRRFLAPVIAAVVLVAVVIAFFAGDTAILLVFPTGDTWARFAELVNAATLSISRQAVPAVADPGIAFLLVTGVGAIAFLADLFAVTLRSPALAGLPLLVLLAVPGFTDFDLSDGLAFILAAVGYLWLLVAGRPQRRGRVAFIVAAISVVGAVLVPAVLPPVAASDVVGTQGLSTGVNPVLNLGRDLRRLSETTALTYSTASGDPHYLRLVTLENFSGKSWAPDKVVTDRDNAMSDFEDPPGLSDEVKTEKEVTDIQVANLTSPWLPLPYPTSRVTGLDGQWFWESSGLSASSPDRVASGQQYQVTSVLLDPTPAQLTEAGTVVPSGFGKYLDLPNDLPAIISNTAESVGAEEATNYEKAVALQEFFRNGDFNYSESAPVSQGFDGTGMAVIEKFLQVKSGYCIHFASAMAVMARTLGIPARVAVGFLPGTRLATAPQASTDYRVTSHDLHAWPELYFENIGWVPFEPTPGRGILPSYADQTVPGVPVPVSQAPVTSAPTVAAAPTDPAKTNDQGQNGGTPASAAAGVLAAWLWTGGALLVAILLVLTPAAIRRGRRESRFRGMRRGGSTAVLAWQEVRDTAEDVGLRLPTTGTPREEAAALAEKVGGTADDGALGRLRAAVERESYASSPPATPAAIVDVREIARQLRASVVGSRRIAVALLPGSVLNRFLHPSR